MARSVPSLLSARAKIEMVRQAMETKDRLKIYLEQDGPEVIKRLMEANWSLRGIARATGYSPTYLCFIKSGDQRSSAEAYLALLKLEAGIPKTKST